LLQYLIEHFVQQLDSQVQLINKNNTIDIEIEIEIEIENEKGGSFKLGVYWYHIISGICVDRKLKLKSKFERKCNPKEDVQALRLWRCATKWKKLG